MALYKSIWDRQTDRHLKFRGVTRGPDINEKVIYEGEIVPKAGGELFTITNITGRLLNGSKDVGRTLKPEAFTGRSRQEVQRKLASALDSVKFTDSGDSLLREIERDRHERNRSSAYTERTIRREPAPTEPTEKLVFGLKVGDPALRRAFESACSDWVRQHAAEFDDSDMTDGERALAADRMLANLRSVARLLEKWALGGQIKVITAKEVEDARAWLVQRGFWQPIRRKRGQSAGREFFPDPEPEPKPAQKDPRSMSLEELRAIEKNRQRRVKAQKGLNYVSNGLGRVI